MKNVMRVFSAAALAAAFALPAFAQAKPPAAPAAPATTPAAAPNICTEDARTELYTKYFTEKKTDQSAAFATGKTYLEKYASCDDTYTKAVKKFVDAYGSAKLRIDALTALEKGDYNTAVKTGGEVLAANPDDVQLIALLGYYGYKANEAGNAANNAFALANAKKAIQMLEAGQAPEKWVLFKGKDDALSYLNFAVGELTIKDNPTEAATAYLKASQIEGDLKKQPAIYYKLALAYAINQYNPLLTALTPFAGKDETPESKLAFANFHGAADRVIDAYARAVALTTDATKKAALLAELKPIYVARNTTETGLNELIAGVLSKPLLEPFVPATTPAPAATPTTTGATPATGTTPPVGGTEATTTTPATPAAKPPAAAGTTTTPAAAKPPASTTVTNKPEAPKPAKPAKPAEQPNKARKP